MRSVEVSLTSVKKKIDLDAGMKQRRSRYP